MKDIPDLLEGLKRSGHILRAFVHSIPNEKLNLRRGEGFWTIAEHVDHLAKVQPMLLKRIQRFMAEEKPVFVPYIPKDEPEDAPLSEISLTEALDAFDIGRVRQLDLLQGLDQQVWEKTATHPEYERYSLYILVRHILMHDHWHMYRMEELWLTKDEYLTEVPG